jgi:hypothetical protein
MVEVVEVVEDVEDVELNVYFWSLKDFPSQNAMEDQ